MAATQALKYLVTADTGGFVKSIGGLKGIAIAAGAAITAAFAKAISITADFQEALARLEALSGATGNSLRALEGQAKKLGATTASTASEILSLQTELAKLGFTTIEILKATPGVRDFADAMEADLASAATLAGNVLRQFGLDASETGRVVDVLSKASVSSALDFEKLRESMKTAGPAAKSVGISLEETVAVLAALSDLGISGSLGGTAFKKFVSSAAKSGRTVTEIFEQIATAADPAAESIKLLGDRTFGAGVAIAQSQGKVAELVETLKEAEGTTKKIAETKLDHLKGDFKLLNSALEALGTELGEIFIPILRIAVKALIKFIGFIQKVVKGLKLLFRGVQLGFLSLAEGILYSIKKLREFAGVDTSKLDEQLEGLRKKMVEINKEIDILKGKEIKLDDDPTKVDPTKPDPKTKPQERTIAAPVLEIKPVLSTTYEQAAEWQEHARKIVEAFSQAWNIETKNLGQLIVPGSIEIGNALKASIAQPVEEVKELANEAGQALSAAAASAFSGLGVAIGEALAGQGDIGEKFLKLIGTFMVQFGSALVALGIAEAAWISSLDPVTKIIAGGALIIAGALISAVAKKKPGNKGSAPLPSSNPTATTTTPQSVQGEGAGGALVATVRGQDLRFVLQSADSNYNALN